MTSNLLILLNTRVSNWCFKSSLKFALCVVPTTLQISLSGERDSVAHAVAPFIMFASHHLFKVHLVVQFLQPHDIVRCWSVILDAQPSRPESPVYILGWWAALTHFKQEEKWFIDSNFQPQVMSSLLFWFECFWQRLCPLNGLNLDGCLWWQSVDRALKLAGPGRF